MQKNIENIIMVISKHLQINQIEPIKSLYANKQIKSSFYL